MYFFLRFHIQRLLLEVPWHQDMILFSSTSLAFWADVARAELELLQRWVNGSCSCFWMVSKRSGWLSELRKFKQKGTISFDCFRNLSICFWVEPAQTVPSFCALLQPLLTVSTANFVKVNIHPSPTLVQDLFLDNSFITSSLFSIQLSLSSCHCQPLEILLWFILQGGLKLPFPFVLLSYSCSTNASMPNTHLEHPY